MLVATIVSIFSLFSKDDEQREWSLAGHEILAAFLFMRLFQFLLGLGLTRGQNTSRTFVCATVTLFIAIYFLCSMIVIATAGKYKDS